MKWRKRAWLTFYTLWQDLFPSVINTKRPFCSRDCKIGHLKTALARNSEERSFFILNCRESAKVYFLPVGSGGIYSRRASYAPLLVMCLVCFFSASVDLCSSARKHFLLLFFGEQFNFKRGGRGCVGGARLECIEK